MTRTWSDLNTKLPAVPSTSFFKFFSTEEGGEFIPFEGATILESVFEHIIHAFSE